MRLVAYVSTQEGDELLSITPLYERRYLYDGARTVDRPEALALVWDWAEQGYQIDIRHA